MKRKFIYTYYIPRLINLISAGYRTNAVSDSYGQLWTWAENNYGQLGINTLNNEASPRNILTNKKICKVSIGTYHSLGIDSSGQLWSWGYNNRGQLGDNTVISKRTPVSIHGSKKTFCSINAGMYTSYATDYNNNLWGWGYIPEYNFYIPGKICHKYLIISASNHSLGIDLTNQIWGWGRGAEGQLGDNSTTNRSTPVSILGSKKTFCSITTGFYHSSGIDFRGQLWGWGNNQFGQLGDNSVTSRNTPVSILGSKKTFCSLAAGMYHCLGIDPTGQLWSWGYNIYGQLGDNSTTNRSTPISILGTKKTFCSLAAGLYHYLSIDLTGQIWSWGFNNYGQLGDSSLINRSTPISILGTKKTFCKIAAAYYTSLGIDYKGQVWGWGANFSGVIGDNSTTSRSTPVSILGAKKTFCSIAGGEYHSLGIDYTGQLWSWGTNVDGRLGDNSVTSRRTPISIHGTKKTFCSIAAGGNYSLGIDHSGQLWSWGLNSNGQLGRPNSNTPVLIYI